MISKRGVQYQCPCCGKVYQFFVCPNCRVEGYLGVASMDVKCFKCKTTFGKPERCEVCDSRITGYGKNI